MDNVLLVTRITAVTDMHSTLFASRTLGTGEGACVLTKGREPFGKEVTVVTQVILPEAGTTHAAGVTELKC
jgi:hypothetical protein